MTKEQREFKKKINSLFNSREKKHADELVSEILEENDDLFIQLFRLSKNNPERALLFLQHLSIALITNQINIPYDLGSRDKRLIRAINIITTSLTEAHNSIIDEYGREALERHSFSPRDSIIGDVTQSLAHLKAILFEMSRKDVHLPGKKKKVENHPKRTLLRQVLYKSEKCFGRKSNSLALALSKSRALSKIFGDEYSNPKAIKRINDSLKPIN